MNNAPADAPGWAEIGPGCFARRYPSVDLTIGAVVASDGILLIDTRASWREADELARDLRELSSAPVRWVVNTHWHYDHCFGNSRFADATIYGHESVPETLAARAEEVRADLSARSPEWARDLADLVVVPPNRTFAAAVPIDLGDRWVEVMHPGPGHTAGDVVVRVHDADVVYVGDLVEQSGPPSYGDDCHPAGWSGALDLCVGLMTDATAVVPGHGDPVDKAFVVEQREVVTNVAQTIRQLVDQGVPEAKALDATDWPLPKETMADAVRRGYAELGGPARRQLPLA